MPPKRTLYQLIELLDPEHRRVALAVAADHAEQYQRIPGASHNHQAWPGGYVAHIEEAMNIGIMLYDGLNERRKLQHSLSSLLFCIYLHDFDKLLRYTIADDGSIVKRPHGPDELGETVRILKARYDYALEGAEYNAIRYAHGEGDYHQPTERIMQPLATLVHCADVISARVWHDRGHNSDSWNN